MDWLHQIDTQRLLVFTLVLTRVSGLLATAPVYGTRDVPMTVRALLAFTLALLIMPTQWNAPFPEPGSTVMYAVVIGSELLVGLCLGLGILLLLAGVQMAGELLSRVGGLSVADLFDPMFGEEVPLFSRLLVLIGTAVFVAVGGHRTLMAGLLDTFQTIPPGGAAAVLLGGSSNGSIGGPEFLPSLVDMFVLMLSESSQLAIRAAIPIVTAILVATLVLGLIGRAIPQLNVLAVGFGLNALITFGVLALSLGTVAWTFQERIEPTLAALFEALQIPIHPM